MAIVAQAIDTAGDIVALVLEIAKYILLVWLALGGWLYGIRLVEFIIDKTLVSFIARVYSYFLMILNGTMFNETLLNDILMNIYVFIGVVIVFRLMMVLLKYLINPDLVADAKLGANSLIKRVIIGFVGILLVPTIFDFAMRLQAAIIEDQVIQKLIIPKAAIQATEEHIADGGKYIGTYVLTGFVSPSANASQKTQKEFKAAVANGDPSNIHINRGGFMADVDSYEYSYLIILSTVILFKVFYQILTYTVDLAVRAFKMLILQILAPVAMVEYMIKGADDGVFKNWRSAVIGCYCSIFIKVAALWFVIFITLLMSGTMPGYTTGSLLATDDYLLRAIIIIALIGFMMDMPKVIGQIFGFDFEQQSSAANILKEVGGLAKGLAFGAFAAGGAALASLPGAASNALKFGGNISELRKNGNLNASSFAGASKDLRKNLAASNGAFFGALAGSTPITKQAYSSWNDGAGKVYGGWVSDHDNERKSAKEKREHQQEQEELLDAINDATYNTKNPVAQETANNIAQNNPNMSTTDIAANVAAQLQINADGIAGIVAAIQAELARGADLPIRQVANKVEGLTGMGNTEEVRRIITEEARAAGILTDSGQINHTASPAQVTSVVDAAATRINTNIEQQANVAATTAVEAFPRDTSGANQPQHGYVNGAPVVVQEPVPPVTVASSGGTPPVSVSGTAPTITLDSLDIKVTGNARATYDGDLETNIKGKAVTTYDGDLETKVNGIARAVYDGDMETQITGTARALYNGDIETEVGGNAKATYYGDIDTEVAGSVNTTVHQDVDTTIEGNVTNTIRQDVDNLVEGKVSNIVEQDVENLVQGNVTNTIQQNMDTTIQQNRSTVVNNDDITQINGGSRTTVNSGADVNINGDVNVNVERKNNGGRRGNPLDS